MAESSLEQHTRPTDPVGRVLFQVSRLFAIFGGFILCAMAVLTTLSVSGRAAFSAPITGDFELIAIGTGVAVFAFLPYCQIYYKNVTADIFTTKAGPPTILMFRFLASLVALLFACLLCWRMFAGMLNQYQYDYTTAIVQFPIWLAFVPILWSLFLLSVAALISLCDEARAIMKAR